jgi:hypothetical protein
VFVSDLVQVPLHQLGHGLHLRDVTVHGIR